MRTGDVFKSSFLKAEDLAGRKVRVTIEDVTMEDLGDDRKAVLHFVGKDKGLVLNRTNWNRLVEAMGSDESNDWHGGQVTLYQTKVDFQGKRVDSIRISDEPGSAVAPQRREPGEDDGEPGF